MGTVFLKRIIAFTFLFFCLKAAAVSFYMNNIVTSGEKTIPFEKLVRIPPGSEKLRKGISPLAVNINQGKITVIPSSFIRENLFSNNPVSAGRPPVIIGGFSAVVPEKLYRVNCKGFYRDLIRHLLNREDTRGKWLEISLLTPGQLPRSCDGGEFAFTTLAEPEIKGPVAGNFSIYYNNLYGDPMDGILKLYVKQTAIDETRLIRNIVLSEPELIPSVDHSYKFHEGDDDFFFNTKDSDTATPGLDSTPAESSYRKLTPKDYAVRAGDKVNLSFYKNSIRLEIPGTAYSSGELGDIISVRPSISGGRFDGLVTGIKEVRVEIR